MRRFSCITCLSGCVRRVGCLCSLFSFSCGRRLNRGDEADISMRRPDAQQDVQGIPPRGSRRGTFPLYAFVTPHHYSSSPDENLFIRWQNNLKIFPKKMFNIYFEWSHIEPNGIMVVLNVNYVVLWWKQTRIINNVFPGRDGYRFNRHSVATWFTLRSVCSVSRYHNAFHWSSC